MDFDIYLPSVLPPSVFLPPSFPSFLSLSLSLSLSLLLRPTHQKPDSHSQPSNTGVPLGSSEGKSLHRCVQHLDRLSPDFLAGPSILNFQSGPQKCEVFWKDNLPPLTRV